MKKWLDIRENQIGLMFAIGHWALIGLMTLVWTISYFTRSNNLFSAFILVFTVVIAAILFTIDSFAMIPAALLWSPFYFFGDFKTFGYGVLSMSFLTISLEWIFIGRYFYDRSIPLEMKLKTLSILDE